jgi:hypothetical protein
MIFFLPIFIIDDRCGDSMLLVAGEMVFQFVSGQRVSDGNLETNIRARLQFAKVCAISRLVSGRDFSSQKCAQTRDRHQGATSVRKTARNLETGIRARL